MALLSYSCSEGQHERCSLGPKPPSSTGMNIARPCDCPCHSGWAGWGQLSPGEKP